MDFDVFTRLIDQFPDLEELQLQGLGEPMMHPRFFDMVAHAVRRGIRVGTNTNLTLLNARRAELCVTSGLGELHASIDGATAAVYDRIRVRADFERIITNLERLVETRARLASETPRIRMVVVAMRQNIHELPDLVRLAHRLAINEVFVQHLCHDFQESSLPAQYRPMRNFVTSETLTSEDPERVQRHFDEARRRGPRAWRGSSSSPHAPASSPSRNSRPATLRLALAWCLRERSATTESGAASGQRMPFPDYVSAQGPVPTPWTQVDPVVFSRLRRAAPGELQRPCGCAWSNSGRMVENVSRRARSVDVFQQGRFLFPCQPLTSPLPKSPLHRTRGRLSFKDRLQ